MGVLAAENIVDAAVEVLREAATTQSIPGKRVFWALRQLETAKIPVECISICKAQLLDPVLSDVPVQGGGRGQS